ncbi:hypothetical protein T10_11822 [Trichinella papuae]|uniref:Uncharacterized protein n=1 Tax=Trichinella papuae TaxID=268474 RepID=A0A0V1N2B7_9BILA|nr:hypothetical protein T10_11822 [Trichinella papuae]
MNKVGLYGDATELISGEEANALAVINQQALFTTRQTFSLTTVMPDGEDICNGASRQQS